MGLSSAARILVVVHCYRDALIDTKLCSLELSPILPPEVYSPLEEGKFGRLRDAVTTLYKEWL